MIARLSIAAVLVTLVCPAAMAETPTPAAPSVAHPAALAQQRTDTLAAPFAFDVASIKPSDPNARAGGGGFDATGYRITNYPLWLIIRSAYFSLISHGTQLIGLPAWADKEHYDVLAHIDEASASAWVKLGPLQRQQPGRLMLQQLLADRCKLVAHTVPTQVDGYILVVGKGGSRLTPSKPGATYPADARDGPDGSKVVSSSPRGYSTINFFNTSVQQLATTSPSAAWSFPWTPTANASPTRSPTTSGTSAPPVSKSSTPRFPPKILSSIISNGLHPTNPTWQIQFHLSA
jgi:uncharacterized protein (TIGR03435 family)